MGRGKLLLLLLLLLPVAHAVTEEQQLATLANLMLNLTGTNDYVMDCGPSQEVLNQPAIAVQTQGSYYCIMNMSGKLIFGTFVQDTLQGARPAILQVYNDTVYQSQIKPADVDTNACNAIGTSTFEECPNAIKNMHVYAYDDGLTSDAIYLIVSEQSLPNFAGSTTFFGSVQQFFTSIFGWFT